MPATARCPPRSRKCFEGKAGKYGRNLVSTGRLHDRRARTRSTSRRATRSSRRAASTARRCIDLVRNPNYDPKTDTKAARENFPDEFKFIVNANADDI